MTTSPVITITDELIAELERLAVDANGWNMPAVFQEPEEGFLPEDWEWYVGQIDEEDNRYPLLHVNAHQYDSGDSEKLARYYAACNRDTILALLAERAELKRDAARYRHASKRESDGGVDICICKVDWNAGTAGSATFAILTADNAHTAIDAAMQAAQ